MRNKVEHEISGGNVFEDIGLPNAQERLAKAQLASKIVCLYRTHPTVVCRKSSLILKLAKWLKIQFILEEKLAMSCNTCCKKVRHVPLIIFFALLTGCASSARYTEMAVKNAEVNITVKKNSVFAKNIAIEKLTGGKKTNPLWLSQVDNEGFFKALKSSLLNLGYLSSDPKARFQLVVSLEKLKQPFLGFAFDCKVTCRTKYALYDSKLKKSVFEQTIATPYIAPFLSELYSVKRIRLANEGAVKENIKQFLQVLGALNTKS